MHFMCVTTLKAADVEIELFVPCYLGEELWLGGDLTGSSVRRRNIISDSDCPQKGNFGAAFVSIHCGWTKGSLC